MLPPALPWAFAPTSACPLCLASPALPTCRTDEGQAANIFWVLSSVDASNIPPHGSANQMKGLFVQLDALHELAESRRGVVRRKEKTAQGQVIREVQLKSLRLLALAAWAGRE